MLDNTELMELLLPMIRADFTLGERYSYKSSLRLPVPLTVFTGRNDSHVSEHVAREWAEESSVGCDLHIFEGGHFFIHQQQRAVLDCLKTILNETGNNIRAAA